MIAVNLNRGKGMPRLMLLMGVAFIFSFFSGARGYTVGTDTGGYGIEAYYVARTSSFNHFFFFSQFAPWAPLAKAIMWLASQIGSTPFWYFFTIELITVIPVILSVCISCKENMPIAMVVFALVFYPMTFNAMRQMMAMGFLLLGWALMSRKKTIFWFFLMGIIACSFHSSSVFAFLIYPICELANGRSFSLGIKLWFLGIAMVVLLLLAQPMMNLLASFGFYSDYLSGSKLTEGSSLRTIIEFIAIYVTLGFAASMFMSCGGEESDSIELMQLALLVLFGVLAFALSIISLWLYRFGLFFIYFSILLLPKIVSCIYGKAERWANVIAIVIVCVAFSYDYYFVCLNNEVVPYVFANQIF